MHRPSPQILAGVTVLLVAWALGVLGASQPTPLAIGYLELSGDPRYEDKRAYARIRVKPHDRPFPGAALAIRESRIIGRALGIAFRLERREAPSAARMIAELERLHEQDGVYYFLIDAGAEVLDAVANATAGRDLVLFNISEPADALRGAGCHAHLFHTIPSNAMLTDALAQFLVARRWRRVLILEGPLAEDGAFARAFERSARRFGVRVIGIRHFVLGNDPREREKNNVALMTSEGDYDVVFLADTEGEFGRYVPYQTRLPRPVLGTEGLIATAWHWAWERHGAPQLNQRFEGHAKRRMSGADWSAWVAVKAIVESVVRTRSTDFKTVRAYLGSDALTLDGYKGNPVNFRPWDNQLRQPILLRTHNAIVARAPFKGFLHPTEYMDTLGFDRGDEKCRLGDGG